ncbi:MAG: tail fiber domain-containing protein [Anaerolineae bacterium]|nr:tail fiber domain-containing protein [Anaerolineae bacterium]
MSDEVYKSLKRNLFFSQTTELGSPTGKELFQDYRDYHLPLAQMHHANLHGWGVVRGLELSGAVGGSAITVSPGIAIDNLGRLIALSEEGSAAVSQTRPTNETDKVDVPVLLQLTPDPETPEEHTVYITIQFEEIFIPEQDGAGPRLEQVPWLRIQPVSSFTENEGSVILGIAILNGASGTLVDLIDQDEVLARGRRLAGQSLTELQILRQARDEITTDTTTMLSIANVISGTIRSGANGGLTLTVPRSEDRITVEETTGGNFAELSIQANTFSVTGNTTIGTTAQPAQLSVNGDLTVTADMEVLGSSQFNGNLSVTGNTRLQGNFVVLDKTGIRTINPDHDLQVGDASQPVSVSLRGPDLSDSSSSLAFEENAGMNGQWFKFIHDTQDNTLKLSSLETDPIMAFKRTTGRVGIGLPEPGERLEVNGRIKAGALTIGSWPASSSNYVFFGTNALDQSNDDNYALLQDSAGSGRGRTYLNSPVDIRFRVANRDKMVLTQSGKIGIGTADPRTDLHVLGRISTGLDFNSAGAITFYPPDGYAWFHIDNGPKGKRPQGRLRISHGNKPGDHEIVNILQNGTVGIGTNSPDTTLHVVGNRIRLMNTKKSNQYIDLRADGSALDLQSSLDLYLNNNGKLVWYRNLKKVSSREFKEEITDLTAEEAVDILGGLNPVKYKYKGTEDKELHLGFIAEEVPNLIATENRKGISPMHIIAVLCGAMKKYRQEVLALREEINRLQIQFTLKQ